MSMNRIFVLTSAVAGVWSAWAGTVALQMAGDSTLAEALSAYNAANSTAYVDTDGGTSLGANDVVVSGTGTLTFSAALGSWTGKLTVKSGAKARVVVNQTTALGNASTGAVYVENGGALILDHSQNVGNGHAIARPIHIAGAGAAAGESGALKLIGNHTSFRSALPKSLHLDADATLCFGADTSTAVDQDHQFILDDGSARWSLNGRTLTVTGAGFPRDNRPPIFFWGSNVEGNGGRIVHDGAHALMRSANFTGGAECAFVLRNGAQLQVQACNTMPAWTLEFEETAKYTVSQGLYQHYLITNDMSRIWKGPVRIPKTLSFVDNGNYTNSIGFSGKISGAGGLCVSTTQPREQHRFNLFGAGSDFTGGLAVTNHVVHLGAPDAVPAGAGAGVMSLKNSDLLFRYDSDAAADFAFPDTVFDGSGRISAADGTIPSGAFKSLVKTGDGTLELRTGLTGGDIVVQGGTLKLLKGDRAEQVGVRGGQSKSFDCFANPFTSTSTTSTFAPGTPLKDAVAAALYTDNLLSSPDIFYTTVATAADKTAWQAKFFSRLTTYSGYLLNESDAAKTIRIVCTLNAYIQLKLGERVYNYPSTGDIARNEGTFAPLFAENFVLNPGCTRVEIRIFDRYGRTGNDSANNGGRPFCYGNVRTKDLVNWDDRHGLMWTEKLESVDMNDYHAFTEVVDGVALLRTSRYEAADRRVDSISGSGILDLNGGTLAARQVSGDVRIVNGLLNVTEGQQLTAGVNTLFGTIVDPARVAGMNSGKVAHPEPIANSVPRDLYASKTLNANAVPVLGLDFFYTTQNQMSAVFGRYPYVTYDGYLWNNTDRDQKWTIASTHDGLTRVVIGSQTFESPYQWYTNWEKLGKTWQEGCSALWTDVTLKPGANKFTVYIAAQYTSAPYVGNVAFGAGTNWVDALGLAFDPQNRKTFDMQYFQKFIDAGDGRLLTHRLVESAIGCSYEAVAGAKGAVVDLVGAEAFVKDFTGGAVVSNGLIHLTGSLTMTAAEIRDADVCLDGVAFAAGSVFDVSDDAKNLRPKTLGWVVARNVVGTTCPTLGPKLAADGWTIVLNVKDGEVRVCKTGGMMIIMR